MSRTLERAITLLMCFADPAVKREESMTPLRDLAAAANLDKATTHRFLQSFARFGLVEYDGSGRYALGPAAMMLARAASRGNSMLSRALPVMRELADLTDETISLAERRDLLNVTIYEIESSQSVRYANKIGAAAPLHASAGCRVTLAFSPPPIQEAVLRGPLKRITPNTIIDSKKLRALLPKIHAARFAVSSGERVPGTNSIAAPILGADGYARGAISILWPSRGAKADRDRIAKWPEKLMSMVQKLHDA